MEEYAGSRDLNSLRQFVIAMKTKASVADDTDNELVTDHATQMEFELSDLFEDEADEADEAADAEKPAEVEHLSFVLI